VRQWRDLVLRMLKSGMIVCAQRVCLICLFATCMVCCVLRTLRLSDGVGYCLLRMCAL
jgi:hypothetical protein